MKLRKGEEEEEEGELWRKGVETGDGGIRRTLAGNPVGGRR